MSSIAGPLRSANWTSAACAFSSIVWDGLRRWVLFCRRIGRPVVRVTRIGGARRPALLTCLLHVRREERAMNSTNHDENESPPSEDEDRSLLFGPPKEGTEPAGDRQKPRRSGASASPPPSRTSPPAAEAAAEPSDPAGRAGPVASSDAVQRRILALLEDLEKKVAGPAAREADLAAAVRTIAGEIAAATEWVNNIKAAISETPGVDRQADRRAEERAEDSRRGVGTAEDPGEGAGQGRKVARRHGEGP